MYSNYKWYLLIDCSFEFLSIVEFSPIVYDLCSPTTKASFAHTLRADWIKRRLYTAASCFCAASCVVRWVLIGITSMVLLVDHLASLSAILWQIMSTFLLETKSILWYWTNVLETQLKPWTIIHQNTINTLNVWDFVLINCVSLTVYYNLGSISTSSVTGKRMLKSLKRC